MATAAMNRETFKRAMGRYPRRGTPIPLERQRLPPLDVGALYHYWHPDRDGVEQAPDDVKARLRDIHSDLAIVRPPGGAPVRARSWLVWARKPQIQHPLSPGWILLFPWEDDDEGRSLHPTPLPIDNRVYANIYMRSRMEYGNAVAYFDHCVRTLMTQKANRTKADANYRHDRLTDLQAFHRIKNIGRGNKFAAHHDGAIVAGRGDAAWAAERARFEEPGEITRRRKRERERGRG